MPSSSPSMRSNQRKTWRHSRNAWCNSVSAGGRSQRCFGAAAICFAVLFTLTAGPTSGFAQTADSPGFSFKSIPKINNNPSTAGSSFVKNVSFDDESPRDVIATTDHTFAIPDGVDVSAELADMRDRLQSQENQIATLRSQLRTPSAQRANRSASRWFSTYESVIVQPLQENTTGLIIETDSGYAHVAFPWKLQHSPRVQFGHETTNDSLGWRVRYWQFRHSKSFHANEANGLLVPLHTGKVGYVSQDGDITLGLDSIEEGRFTSSVRTDVIDWELQRQIAEPIDVYAGIRYAKVAQRYAAVTDAGNAWANSSLRGVGPTVAMRLQHDLAVNRLSLFANLRGSLLFGHKEFSVYDDANDELQTIGNDDVRISSDGGDTLSANTEIQLGFRFVPSDWLAFTVAFETQAFTNVGGPNPTGVFTGDDSGLAGDSPLDDSLSFAGVTVGTEVTW